MPPLLSVAVPRTVCHVLMRARQRFALRGHTGTVMRARGAVLSRDAAPPPAPPAPPAPPPAAAARATAARPGRPATPLIETGSESAVAVPDGFVPVTRQASVWPSSAEPMAYAAPAAPASTLPSRSHA